jgi:isopentenyl-diphosphate delta-isomerase
MSTTTTIAPPSITADNVLRLFPEVNTAIIGAARSNASHTDLEGYDEEQIRLMDEVCIVLDENDLPIGSASKKACKCTCKHGGKHSAFMHSVVIEIGWTAC